MKILNVYENIFRKVIVQTRCHTQLFDKASIFLQSFLSRARLYYYIILKWYEVAYKEPLEEEIRILLWSTLFPICKIEMYFL